MLIDRKKYIDIMNRESVNAALTELHKDVRNWELEAFEGQKGWQPQMWDELAKVRSFSRELWEMALQQS
jgi:hypothetical protein